MWYVIGAVIGGIIGIAAEILKLLQQAVAVERRRWEDSYVKVHQEIINQQALIEQKLQDGKLILKYQEITNLHSASIKLADATYSLLDDSRKTLDAMGQAIVNTAIQRKTFEKKKRDAFLKFSKRSIQQEIVSLQKLRDEILIPDKDKVKSQRDILLTEVRKLNQQTAELRDLKKEIKDNKTPVLQEDQKGKHNNKKRTGAADRMPKTELGLPRDEFETVDEYERRINGLPPFRIGNVSFGRYIIEQGILPIESMIIYDWAIQLKPTEGVFFLVVDRETAKSLKSSGVQEFELFVKAQATATKLAVERLYINWNNKEFQTYSATSECGRDGRFIAYYNETVLDTSTNLMWAAKDSGEFLDWRRAESYCKNYRGGGYADWRMPTQDELAGLRASGNYKNVIAFEPWVWASKTGSSSADAGFNFGDGHMEWSHSSSDFYYRALPVRSGK